jgi:N-acetylglucosamine-6-sulfatase
LKRAPRAGFGALAILTLLAAGIAAAAVDDSGMAAPAPDGPNFVVIMTDDQETDTMRAMPLTRALIGDEGVTFRRHYATFPLCCPSRASYLTGQFSHNNGVTDHRGFSDFEDSTSVAVALQDAGYRTAWIGKFLNGYPSFARQHPDEIPAGFTRWFATITGRMFNFVVDDDGTLTKVQGGGSNQTDVDAEIARTFIRDSAALRTPFFLTVATLAPHGEPKRDGYPDPRPPHRHRGAFEQEPLPQPPSFDERRVGDKPGFVRDEPPVSPERMVKLRDRNRARLASLLAVDDLVAGIVEELAQAGELDDTYIVFTSDNGYLKGEHRVVGKVQLYEESAKVPMVMRGPGIPPGGVHGEPTANIDVPATILDAAGIKSLAEPDGVSLLPTARRPDAPTGRLVLLENLSSHGLEDGRYVYLEHDRDPEAGSDGWELYDLRRDPYELRNLSLPDEPRLRPALARSRPGLVGVRDRLDRLLDELRDCAGTTGPDACAVPSPR